MYYEPTAQDIATERALWNDYMSPREEGGDLDFDRYTEDERLDLVLSRFPDEFGAPAMAPDKTPQEAEEW